MTAETPDGRLIVVSNRIPTEGQPAGGLVVALHEALLAEGGVWIGHSGVIGPEAGQGLTPLAEEPYARRAFDLSEEEHAGFYLGYANSVLWPLFHHRADLIAYDEDDARIYREVNARVAQLVAQEVQPGDRIWIHDYHFLPLAHELRKLGLENRIGFFLHIPFPVATDLAALPESRLLPEWLAAFDLVGLQTARDVTRALLGLRTHGGAELLLGGRLKIGGREVDLRSFPIGIDVDTFRSEAEAAGDIDAMLGLAPGEKLMMGVDRLDYSKGLPQRFRAFGKFLEEREADMPRATLLQIAQPSREDVEAYKDIRDELESLSGSVNGRHALLDWTPIRYIHRGIERSVLAGLYRRADVMLVTPLADGMNLVAKEYVAAQDPEDPGVLILSHFAGAAEQLTEAVMVNPYDTAETGRALRDALTMPLEERRRRHAALLEVITREDIGWWTRTYLRALAGRPRTIDREVA